ncbi:GTP pyrophosphokinase family protein [Paenibacillus polygoni]|uniref:GTP pyrophosphokinase family protein n=1 Tax=Paenibacillus polygoni TaxID=3050112 RepID=A0ABY8X638_9BACL|nr:GTP pyrophosphokinase family protein [Paenibacillus polygoni]WIV21002.1 GTP pyrophosphokinase family protein [Paenibacillus polygoni]
MNELVNHQNQMEQVKRIKNEITRFIMVYKFALDEIETKIDILKEEFESFHDYSPIEHTKSRLKSPESILKKLHRKGLPISVKNVKEHIKDIAGLRITCSFISDIYKVSEMLQKQSDLKVLGVKDYIEHPKPNGYKSLHLIVEVPVFLSDGVEQVCVEIQIRTIAMDFWASLEHKIFYKYNKDVPETLLKELKSAADTANSLDLKMERLHHDIKEIKDAEEQSSQEDLRKIVIRDQQFMLPSAFLEIIDQATDSFRKDQK